LRNCTIDCDIYKEIELKPDQYELSNFVFENMNITEKSPEKAPKLDDAGGHVFWTEK
jgi:hypothetical protein